MEIDLTHLTIKKIQQSLLKKEFSALSLAKAYFAKIKEKDKEINSFITLSEELAFDQAKKVDEMIARGRDLPALAGIPVAVKDAILVEGVKCTAASKILENYTASYDATVVEKLKQQGAVILGKANMDEFAIGSSGEHSAFGPTKNPNDLERVPGGSSSGSGAAVASDLCCFALGSDTGGSIRLPACFCGVVGLKPTYGAVSRYGLMAMASSLDQIGLIAKKAEDAQIVFNAIKGRDKMDSTSADIKSKENKIKTIGVPKEYFVKGMDAGVEEKIKQALKKFESAGIKIQEISLPHTEYALAVYYIIMTAEVSSNLARYDGIRYGHSAKEEKKLLDVYMQTRGQGFGAEVRKRIMLGTYVLSAGYYDAYYLRAQKVRTLIKRDFEKAFENVDMIVTPTSPTLPFKLGEKITDPLTMYLSDVFTVSLNLAGLPGVSIPCGKIGKLPVGIQLIGKPFEENVILEAAKLFETI